MRAGHVARQFGHLGPPASLSFGVSARPGMNRFWKWFWLGFVLVAVAATCWWLLGPSFTSERGLIKAFGRGIAADTNSDKVIMWARTTLADTNIQAAGFEPRSEFALEAKSLRNENLPPEVAALGTNLFERRLDGPNVTIYRSFDHSRAFVSLGFVAGRVSILGLAIGPTNFTFPTNLVSRSEQWKAGVYFFEVDCRQ
jgi:hypothetical protein